MSSVLRTKAQRGIINSLPYKGRIIDIDSKYLSDSDQNKVVQVLYGRDVLSTSMMFPPWNIQKKESSGGGKGSGKGGGGGSPTFYASIAFAICLGEATSIHNIYESDNNITASEGSGAGLSGSLPTSIATEYGTLRIYRGTATQEIDPSLKTVVVFKSNTNNVYENYPVPDFKHICYAVCDKWKLGSSTSHPNVRIETFKECKKLKEASGHSSDWSNNFDYAPPVILYEMLKDFPAITQMFSDNNGSFSIDTVSFAAAATACANKGIFISVTLDDSSSLSDIVANILEYCDGVIYVENGVLKINLPWKEAEDRNYSAHKTFTTNDLIEEPVVEYQADAWGISKVSFCDRALDYEETTAILEHPDYEGIEGMDVKIEEFDRMFIKQRSVANVLTKYLANVGVKPSVDLTINVLPESVSLVPIDNNTNRDLRVGDLIKVDYDETKYPGLGNVLFRVNSIAIAEDGAEIQAVSECRNFFTFTNTDIFFIEQEKYISMDRDFPYLYPKILVQRKLGANETNGFQNQYNVENLPIFLFVSESYTAGRADFKWDSEGDQSWAPDSTNKTYGIEPCYQKSGLISYVYYDNNSHFWQIGVSLSSDELEAILTENTLSGESTYIVCSRYYQQVVNGNTVSISACTPIIFKINSLSKLTNELICEGFSYLDFDSEFQGIADYSVKTSDNPSNENNSHGARVSNLFFLVTKSELQNCSTKTKLKTRNRFSSKVYLDKKFEKTPGYAAVFYDGSQTNVYVLNRLNDDTDNIEEHAVMWPDNNCVEITIPVSGAVTEYPCLVWDATAGKYYVQEEEPQVEAQGGEGEETQTEERNYLPELKSEISNRFQILDTQSENGSLSFNHTFGSDTFIYVILKHSGNTLTLPSLEGVAPGDSITIIVNAVGVVDYTKLVIASADSGRFLSRSNDNESVPINSITGSTFNVASGITTKLYCVLKNTMEKYWFVDTYSGTETGF